MNKLPELVQKHVNQKIAELLTAEVEKIAIMVYEIAYTQAVKETKARVVKHCDERVLWLETMRAVHPEEAWGVKKAELEFLAQELRSFSEEAQ